MTTATATRPVDCLAEVGEMFLVNIGGGASPDGTPVRGPHQMTIVRDDGVYRHVRFKAPGTSTYHFDLVTWPGHLAISGDLDGFMFRREHDMFGWFLMGKGVNPGYWAQKLVGPGPAVAKEYSEERFRQVVIDHIAGCAEEFPSLAAAVQAEIFDEADFDPANEDHARQLLNDFEHVFTFGGATGLHATTIAELRENVATHVAEFTDRFPDLPEVVAREVFGPAAGNVREARNLMFTFEYGFRFHDTWEWRLDDFDHHFLWACHAIRWGVEQYVQAKATANAAVAPPGAKATDSAPRDCGRCNQLISEHGHDDSGTYNVCPPPL